MMPPLLAALPCSVVIEGKTHPLRSDHHTCLRICCALEDGTLADFEKQAVLLALLYPTVPQNTAKAVELGLCFLNGGTPPEESTAPPLYTLQKDLPYLVAAMQKTHGLDLLGEPMHWYRFLALLSDLDENTFFARLIYLRRARRSGRMTTAERTAAAALGHLLDVPNTQTPSAEAAEFLQLLGTAEQEEPAFGNGL